VKRAGKQPAADVVVTVRARTRVGRRHLRVLASEISAAVESINAGTVTLLGLEWPPTDGHGVEAVVERHERLAAAAKDHPEIWVEVSR